MRPLRRCGTITDMPARTRIAIAAAICLAASGQDSRQAEYFPAAKWRRSTPEAQGIDSQALAGIIDQALQKQLGVHSLLIIRHGYVVLDAYFYPYSAGTPHDVASVTKTLTSVLTGIAVSQGLIQLDQPALSFFPKEFPANPGEQKRKITVGNLVRMESGLDCGYAPGEAELEQMKRSPNWVQFALSLPMKYPPGAHTSYCSPGYHLLGSAIAAAAKQSEAAFAAKNLFAPLGIRDVVWAGDPQGRSHGWGDSHFFPQDLAKIGHLYLHGGQWNGKRIVPADWVAMSIAPPTGPRDGPGGMGYEWNASNGPNGRQYGGAGRGGQSLVVWPELDTVVVITAGGNAGQIAPLVRQAVKSDQPLPANPDGSALLRARTEAAAKAPAPEPVPPLPAIARTISGVVYDLPINTSRLDRIALTFSDKPEARLDVTYLGQPLTLPVALDGVYRLGPHGPLHLLAGAKGKWTNANEFLLDLNFIANINHYTLNLRFDGDRVEIAASEASGLIRGGHLTGTRRP